MRLYLYTYQTIVRFGRPVVHHSVMLRCQPAANACQTIRQQHLVLPPDYWICPGTDAYGNQMLYGGARRPTEVFAYVSTGIVATDAYAITDRTGGGWLYRLPSRLTQLEDSVPCIAPRTVQDPLSVAADICHQVYGMLEYVPDSTDVDTSASEVLRAGRGVCQDYAHLMIALCRQRGLAARYVNGFVEGTGQTHAWVEVHDGCCWRGFDPTHDRQIEHGYVKIAHGRDSADCPVSRGMFCGPAAHQTFINVTLQEL